MPDVIVVVDASRDEDVLSQLGAAVADLVQGRVRSLRLLDSVDPATRVRQVLDVLGQPASQIGVLRGDASEQSMCSAVMQQASTPLAVLPPAARSRPSIDRVLLPLDGSTESADAVANAVRMFVRRGVELIVLHIFGPATVPRFWDQAAHAPQSWGQEFLARNVAQPGVRLELRSGVPDDHVLDVAAAEQVDLIVLGWSQRLDAGRAAIVRRSILQAPVPVLLTPLSS